MKKITKGKITRGLSGWLLMAPSLALFTFFIWHPLLANVRLSFYKTKGFTASEFVGLQNYKTVLLDPLFGKALGNTVTYILWSLAIGFLVPIITALILNEMIYAKGFYRVGVYFPNVVPGVATVMMWALLMSPAKYGVLNVLLQKIGLPPYAWLEDTRATIALIVFTMTWKGAGSTALIYLARLKGVNQEYYEAAAIDGAGILTRFLRITLPQMKNLAGTLLVLQIISVFQTLYEPLIMTGGGPMNASISLMQLSYTYAFNNFEASKSSAVGVITCLILVSLTALYNELQKGDD